MAKELDLTKNVASLCDEYPELIDVMVGLGFKPLANPVMRKMVASHMTIPKASGMMGIPMEKILFALADKGFAVTGLEAVEAQAQPVPANGENGKPRHESGHEFLARMGKTKLRPGGVEATNWLLEQAELTPETKVLEVACNMGTTLVQVAEEHGCHMTGLDLDEKALARAAENVKAHGLEDKVTLVHGSAFELPFPDGSFDVVINEAMLTMLLGDKKDQAIAEYRRVLKPGGVLLTHDVCIRTDDEGDQKDVIAGISRAINVRVEPLTVSSWTRRFEDHGFAVQTKVGAMTLLDPEGMERDEGHEKTLEILANAMKAENAEFFGRMFHFFSENADKLGYIAVASTKTA